jgi:hypothetical protein
MAEFLSRADVQTRLGPFLAAYLASSGWNPGSVGYVLTFGGLVGVAMQTPAGAVIDAVHRKRTLLAVNRVNLGFLVAGALSLIGHLSTRCGHIPQSSLSAVQDRFSGPPSRRDCCGCSF